MDIIDAEINKNYCSNNMEKQMDEFSENNEDEVLSEKEASQISEVNTNDRTSS